MRFLFFILLCSFLISCASGPSIPSSLILPNAVRDTALTEKIEKNRSILYISQKDRDTSCHMYINKEYVGPVSYHHVLKVNLPAGQHKAICYYRPSKPLDSWFRGYYHTYKKTTFKLEGGKKATLYYNFAYSKAHKMNRPFVYTQNVPNTVDAFVKKRTLVKSTPRLESNHISKTQIAAKARAKNNLEKEKKAFSEAKKVGTFDSFKGFVSEYPFSVLAKDAIVEMVNIGKAKKSKKERYKVYTAILAMDSSYSSYLPKADREEVALLAIGPKDFNVGLILDSKLEGLSTKIISAKILATNQRYKNFTIPEIKRLKKMGMNDNLIESMLKVTATYDGQVKAIQQNKEMMAQIQKLINQSQAKTSIAKPVSYSKSSSKTDNSPDMASCLKRKAALEACRNVSGFMRSACDMTAKNQYPCKIK